MNFKHVSKKANKEIKLIAHCPYCRGVIFRDYKKDYTTGEISFKIRCPHCAKNVLVRLKDGIVIREELKVNL